MSTTASSSFARRLPARHAAAQRTLHMGMTGMYLLGKWAVSVPLYALRRAGLPQSVARRLDAEANRLVLPLTERSDRLERADIAPAIRPGDHLPDVTVTFSDGSSRDLRSYAGTPLLLVLVRGSWCSYSRLHLADVAEAAEQFRGAGVNVLAVGNQPETDAWRAIGVDTPVGSDPDGRLFDAFGLRVSSWMETAWGRTLPHESAFLFGSSGRLIAFDVRRVSGIRPGQTFLGAQRWLEIIHDNPETRR